MRKVRCAIYTRKSSEEGLEQDFNSLDAQREACSAYIRSQASEDWTLLKDAYDDGGLSGGTLRRPALQRLLADIAAGRVDTVVVYKVDRLTRSLLDFSKLVEAFDEAGISFVSVTQSFNTTTSMGRLTLNMLLSFAQFEREVTAERIRDKIAASKAKGMWMGGVPPLGYRPDGRSLAIVDDHAELVRHIFQRYLALANVRLLAQELDSAGVHAPRRLTAKGREFGGGPFSRGQLYKILSNRTYLGQIEHGSKAYPGNHQPIITEPLWQQVKETMAANRRGLRTAGTVNNTSLLAGLLVDEHGVPMVASHACKGKMRYRYYASRDLQQQGRGAGGDGCRMPARQIEPLVREHLTRAVEDPIALLPLIGLALPNASELPQVVRRANELAATIRKHDLAAGELLRRLVQRVQLGLKSLTITLEPSGIAGELLLPPPTSNVVASFTIAVAAKRSSATVRLVDPNGAPANKSVDRKLVAAIARGRGWWADLLADPTLTPEALGRRDGVTGGYILRLVRLAFLSPNLVEMIATGAAPASLTLDRLTLPEGVAGNWAKQQTLLHD